MAGADYRICDRCGAKAFYDAHLNYESADPEEIPTRWAGEEMRGGDVLDFTGDWAVICTECAKTHRTVVVPIRTGIWGAELWCACVIAGLAEDLARCRGPVTYSRPWMAQLLHSSPWWIEEGDNGEQ